MPDPVIVLDLDEADDLACLLDRVEDWLRHAGGDTFDDLAAFFNGPGNGVLAAAGLIDLLGGHAATLRHRSRQAS
jgi:hypothetical protein